MSDLQQFEAFFAGQGVRCEKRSLVGDYWGQSHSNADCELSVGQTLFFFKNGAYIGLEGGESGEYESRQTGVGAEKEA